MTDQINELPDDGLKSSPETSHYTENKWISRKVKISCTSYTLLIGAGVFCSQCRSVSLSNRISLMMMLLLEYIYAP